MKPSKADNRLIFLVDQLRRRSILDLKLSRNEFSVIFLLCDQ